MPERHTEHTCALASWRLPWQQNPELPDLMRKIFLGCKTSQFMIDDLTLNPLKHHHHVTSLTQTGTQPLGVKNKHANLVY